MWRNAHQISNERAKFIPREIYWVSGKVAESVVQVDIIPLN